MVHILDRNSTGWFSDGRHLVRRTGAENCPRPTQDVTVDREVTRLLAAAALPLLVVGLAAPASAHVTITPSTTAAGARAVLDVHVPHGCDGSATTAVTIRIPEEIDSVIPGPSAPWDQELETESGGDEADERVVAVTYRTDAPLSDDREDVVALSVELPEAEGTTLVFPTIQTCEQGEAAWIEIPEPGQDPDELVLPAPALVVTAAGSGARQASATEVLAAGATGASQQAEPSVDVPVVAYGVLGLCVLGVMLGVARLARLRRQT
jgi:periplasmic copper chaperone A